MWVYKHDLFHRDRPEDLTLLRRRNGPTSREGRRRQLNDMLPPKASSVNHRSDDESTASSDGDCVILKSKKPDKKRPADVTPNSSVASAPRKRQALLWTTPLPDADNFVLRLDCKVDNSMMQPVLLTESDESDDQGSASSVVDELTNNQDQITVVLEVASQLDLHARRAMIGDRNSKSRSRRSNGVVTPSFAPLRNFMVPSGNLLTYDDEFEDSLDLVKDEDSHVPENSGFVSSDSDTSGIISACRFSAYTLPMANNTVQNIMDSVGIDNQNALITAAKVAIFCLSTSPPRLAESSYHFGRVSELLASCKNLSAEFSLYRSALSPLADNASCLPPVQFGGRHGESPGDATRVFRTFAINALQKLMACAILFVEDDKLSRDGDLEKLECALDAWQSFC